MNLDDFFETNSISLDIISCFEMWKEGNCTKSDCIAESKRIIKEYKGEEGEYLIALMTYYWCLLSSNIVDEKLKTKLESYSLQDIKTHYPEEAHIIYDVLAFLLKEEPKPLVKKKISYSKLRWKPGDVYAISMPSDTKKLCNIDNNTTVYILINCEKVIDETSRNQNITAYILLHFGELEDDLPAIFTNCIALPVRLADTADTGKDFLIYKYYFYDIAKNCPEEQLRYLGHYDNVKNMLKNEFQVNNYLFCGWITWDVLFRNVAHQYGFLKDIISS